MVATANATTERHRIHTPWRRALTCSCRLLVGYVIAYAMMFPIAYWLRRKRYFRSENFTPEDRLFWLLWTAPLLPIGLWIFAWTSLGPPLHWIGPMIASALVRDDILRMSVESDADVDTAQIAIANFMIYQLTIGCVHAQVCCCDLADILVVTCVLRTGCTRHRLPVAMASLATSWLVRVMSRQAAGEKVSGDMRADSLNGQ